MLSNLLIFYIIKTIPLYILFAYAELSEITVVNTFSEKTNNFFFFQKHTQLLYKVLADTTFVDYPLMRNRYQMFYNLLSYAFNSRVNILLYVNELLAVPSLSRLYQSANWFEREIWDLGGVFFFDHPRLRRILTDYGFYGHPLRKDFPTTGYLEMRFSELLQKIVQEPVEVGSIIKK